MVSEEYIRDIPGAPVAVLFIHGILGTPRHFSFLMPLVPGSWSVHNIVLPGHGGTVNDFSHTSMDEWRKRVADEAEALRSSHPRLLIAAHSMGTLFAIREAVERTADALFLLNVPLSIHVTRRTISSPLKILTGRISPEDIWTRAALEAYGIGRDPNPLHYTGWIPRYLELFAEIKEIRRMTPRLSVPSRIYLSARDEMVSQRSAGFFTGNKNVSLTILPESGHYFYAPSDILTMKDDFKSLIDTLKTK